MMHDYIFNMTAVASAAAMRSRMVKTEDYTYVGGAINIESDVGPVLVAVCTHGLNCKEHAGAL